MSTISFCMIVKNASEDLKDILPVMAKVSWEMIVVDTGSKDNTPDVARALGARVIEITWRDSFADARNTYIDAAKGDWIISIDADERIAEKDLLHIASAKQKDPQGFLMTTRNYGNNPGVEGFSPCKGEYPEFEKGFKGWSPSTKVRMFPRAKGLYYTGQVRELIEPGLKRLGIPLGEIRTPIHHFGTQSYEKRLYYRELLEKKVLSMPNDPRAMIELAVEDFHLGRLDKAIHEAEKAISLHLKGNKGFYFDIASAYNLLGAAYMKKGDRDKAIEAFDAGIKAGGRNVDSLKKNRAILLAQGARPKLGAVMIVKNEEKNLPNILGDIKGIVDEIVVVDTGSSDNTVDIARNFGVKLGHFDWCDDFSKARNASIDMADSDYLLWLDADDRISPEEAAKLSRLKKSLKADKNKAWMLKIVNTDRKDGDTISYQLRIFPNRDDVRFVNRVHEQILEVVHSAGIKIDSADITIRHTGYDDEESRLIKARRNLRILLDEVAEGNASSSRYFFIASSYFALKEYDKSLEYIKVARQMTNGSENWLKYSYSLAADCYLKLGKKQRAAQEFKEATRLYKDSGLMHYFLGMTCLNAGLFKDAVKAFETTASLGIEIETYPVPPRIREKAPYYYGKALEKLGRTQEAINAFKTAIKIDPCHYLAAKDIGFCLIKQGDITQALSWLEKARDISQGYDRALWLALAKVYTTIGKHSKALEVYRESTGMNPYDTDALAGLAETSIEANDVESLVLGMEGLMNTLGMDTNLMLDTVEDIAGTCSGIARKLFETGDLSNAERLLNCALKLDNRCTDACLLAADIKIASGQVPAAATWLEKALKLGVPAGEIEKRMQGLS